MEATATATASMTAKVVPMIEGDHYCRLFEGEIVGPAFVVTSVSPTTGNAHLRATTSITGKHTIEADTKDVPNGWYGPMTEDEVRIVERDQSLRTKRGGK